MKHRVQGAERASVERWVSEIPMCASSAANVDEHARKAMYSVIMNHHLHDATLDYLGDR